MVPSPPSTYEHFGILCRRFRKRSRNLVRLSTPRFAIGHADAFQDVEHFCLGCRVAATARSVDYGVDFHLWYMDASGFHVRAH